MKKPYNPKSGKKASSIQDLRDAAKMMAMETPEEEMAEVEIKAPAVKKKSKKTAGAPVPEIKAVAKG